MVEQIQIEYNRHRCSSCGTFYMVEKTRDYNVACPKCAGEEIEEKRQESIRLIRSNRSLRACLQRN